MFITCTFHRIMVSFMISKIISKFYTAPDFLIYFLYFISCAIRSCRVRILASRRNYQTTQMQSEHPAEVNTPVQGVPSDTDTGGRFMKNEFGNTNSKEIWSNHLLCAQYLRNYSGVPLLEHVQPEDITDETEKLRPFLGVEFEGDAVKRVRIQQASEQEQRGELPVYVVALLEHKSSVDYDVTYQLLKCMVGVWTLYRNERDKEHAGISGTKGFRYPLIIPIVHYEGRQSWTAHMHWKDRVELSEMFGEYVPDFTYRVMNLHTYSPEELLSREEEISLVMVFNRVQTADDLDIRNWSSEQREIAQKILQKAPEAVLKLIAQMVHHFGLKLHVPENELEKCIKNVEERNMGELWANMEKMDIQAERRNTTEARTRLAAAQEALAEQAQTIAEKDQALAEQAQTIAGLLAELDRLRQRTE